MTESRTILLDTNCTEETTNLTDSMSKDMRETSMKTDTQVTVDIMTMI